MPPVLAAGQELDEKFTGLAVSLDDGLVLR